MSSIRRESKEEAYDVIVVGSGMGGLSAGALLAKAGKKVLVVERHDRAGGYAHAFRRKKYVFDAAVHLTAGCEPGGLQHELLRLLGVRDRCTFIRADPFYSAVFPGLKIDAPLGVEPFVEAHLTHFPHESKGFRALLQTCARLSQDMRRFPPQASFWDVVKAPKNFPVLVKYQKATLERAMAEHIHDVRLKAVFSTLWPYLGLPPARLSFIYWSAMLMSFLEEGAFYCRESFQKLADAYVEALQKHGGELLLNNRVRRILVKNAQATGVQLENGQKIRASIVISNADAQETFAELVNPRALPSQYQRKLARLKPSLSAFVVYMATKLDLKSMGAGHEMFFYRSWNHEQCFQTMMEGKPAGIVISIPSLVDPSLAPPGEQVLSVITLIPYDLAVSWRKEKSRYAELLLSEVESVFPGLRENLTFAEGASPRTMERYTLNLTGAIYGWEPSPGQVGRNRLSPETPVHGLYLSGHWTRPGGGIYAVTMSGAMVAQRILGLNNLQDLFQSLSN